MALSKQITYDNGTTASYHRIDGLLVCCHPDNGATVTATLYSYLTEDTRAANAGAPVSTVAVTATCARPCTPKLRPCPNGRTPRTVRGRRGG